MFETIVILSIIALFGLFYFFITILILCGVGLYVWGLNKTKQNQSVQPQPLTLHSVSALPSVVPIKTLLEFRKPSDLIVTDQALTPATVNPLTATWDDCATLIRDMIYDYSKWDSEKIKKTFRSSYSQIKWDDNSCIIDNYARMLNHIQNRENVGPESIMYEIQQKSAADFYQSLMKCVKN